MADDESSDEDNGLGLFAHGRRQPAASPRVPAPLRVAATLALARLLDTTPGLAAELATTAPVVLIDVPDPALLDVVRAIWPGILLPRAGKTLFITKATGAENRDHYGALACVVTEAPKLRDRNGLDHTVLPLLAWALPLVAVSPSAARCLPRGLREAARFTLTLPPLDIGLAARTIRLVTGKRCRPGDLAALASPLDPVHLAAAVRHDHTPAACIATLHRLQDSQARQRAGRDLSLDDLHGLEPAVSWARSLIADLAAWRQGDIGWDAVDHGVVLDGPPGTGKTLFASVLAKTAGLPLISGSLAQWQAAGHLGDLLQAMRTTFDAARAQAPSLLFIDEVDAFGDRATMTHPHRDYSIQVVNAFLELLDGVNGREGLVFVAASNHIARCDPAVVRSGRLNRILHIDLPDAPARARMLRVRLGADLPDIDLDRVAALAGRMSGADIEKFVKDARRMARQAGRPLAERDLMVAVAGDTMLPLEILRRVAVHEAGHALLAALHHGPDGLTVTLQSRGNAMGWVAHQAHARAGTRADCTDDLATILAGRAAEEAIFGSVSAGAGGRVGSDLHAATCLAAAMAGSYGLGGPDSLVFAATETETAEILRHGALRAAVAAILQAAYGRARTTIERHRAAVERIAAALIATRHLDGATVMRLIDVNRHGGTGCDDAEARGDAAPSPGDVRQEAVS